MLFLYCLLHDYDLFLRIIYNIQKEEKIET
jgi:hypothetical protein